MIQDNGAKWKVRKFTDFASNQAMPVGYVHWSISPTVPAGELPLLGGTYDRSLYADLWSWANENGLVVSESEWQEIATSNSGNVDKFSNGNGTTTFRVPKLPTTITSDVPSEVPVVGNGMTLGLTNGNKNGGLYFYTSDRYEAMSNPNAYGKTAGGTYNLGSLGIGSVGVTTDGSKSGIVAKTSSTKITGQWLIVAFGTASNVGNADVANVMQAVEQVQSGLGKVDGISDYIIESYRNGTEWYEVYKSGKVRQGGFCGTTGGSGTTITFLKPFANVDYTLTATVSAEAVYFATGMDRTATSFNFITVSFQGNAIGRAGYWVAEGQGA